METRYVRLEGSTAKVKKKPADKNEQTLKLAVRLTEVVNDALRSLIRYRGDLSAKVIEALNGVDLESVKLVSHDEAMVRDTTITISRALHKHLKQVAEDRETSMNIVVNTGLAHWLAAKGLLKLR